MNYVSTVIILRSVTLIAMALEAISFRIILKYIISAYIGFESLD